MEKQLYENKKQKQTTTTTKTLQTRLIFKHDKQYTNKWNNGEGEKKKKKSM